MKTDHDQSLREHLLYLLNGGGAHTKFEDVVTDLPAGLQGKKVANLPYTAWTLLEHIRIAQWDILDFSRNPKYKAMEWPKDYWPATEAPPKADAWNKSIKAFKKDMKEMQSLVADPKTDLYKKIPWGDRQTILREALLIADHNAYHLGQMVTLRRLLGAWKG
jgi:uncharacterized damage-inducible protein DinB